MTTKTLDHVALWVADRDPIAEFLTTHTDMHVIERTDAFTLVGTDARRGKLTLFAAEGPRERGPLVHIALRVSDLDQRARAAARGRRGRPPARRRGLPRRRRGAPHRARRGADRRRARPRPRRAASPRRPRETADAYRALGFRAAGDGPLRQPAGRGRRRVRRVRPGRRRPSPSGRCSTTSPCSSTRRTTTSPRRGDLGVEVAKVVDAANTYAVFLWGPERVKIEYVEHKPSFSLT